MAIPGQVHWFSRLAQPLSPDEAAAAAAYARSLGLGPECDVVEDWREVERIARDPRSAQGWWSREEAERVRLTREAAGRIGEELLLETLTAAVEGHAESTYARAVEAGGDEALARVASGAALMAIHNRALALLSGSGAEHVFVQKYALFASGRWPLGTRGTTFTLF
jgi:hypothetical protein